MFDNGKSNFPISTITDTKTIYWLCFHFSSLCIASYLNCGPQMIFASNIPFKSNEKNETSEKKIKKRLMEGSYFTIPSFFFVLFERSTEGLSSYECAKVFLKKLWSHVSRKLFLQTVAVENFNRIPKNLWNFERSQKLVCSISPTKIFRKK